MHEKLFVTINGRKQGMFLQIEQTDHPVLLYLHGGPGCPEIIFNAQYPAGLEKLFTVCWWEQRGAGISYSRRIMREEMTMEQMIADTLSVVRYLKDRFHQEKIYIMGHSWGSLLGVLTVLKEPGLFHAYIGVGQVARQAESERLGYTYMIQEFRKAKNTKMVRRLEKFPIGKVCEINFRYLLLRNKCMFRLGVGIMHRCTSMKIYAKLLLRYKGYTLHEKYKFLAGNIFSLKCLFDYVRQTDLFTLSPELKLPVYIFQGKYDYQVSYSVAREFAKRLKAPLKGFYTFENSAHSPCFEEPEKMLGIMAADVLAGKASLADDLTTV